MIPKPPYYIVRRKRGFFSLGKDRASRVGMPPSIPLGADGDEARAEAAKLYARWRKLSKGEAAPEVPAKWPPGSLGSWFAHYRTTAAWAAKAPATRLEWENMWRFIGHELGARPIRKITPAEFANFFRRIENQKGPNTRWRVIKVSRALFRAAKDHGVIVTTPTAVMPNSIPIGRHQIWFYDEIMILMEAADRIGCRAMKLAIWIAWETLLQPGDVRALKLSNRIRDFGSSYIHVARCKTGREVTAAISAELDAEIDRYVASLPMSALPSQPLLRTARGHAYLKARFMSDFDRVRKAAFGPDEMRRFQDIRRSGSVEADLGGATLEQRAEMLGNNLHKSRFLQATYTPSTVSKSRLLAKQRIIGRELLANQSRNETGDDVETA